MKDKRLKKKRKRNIGTRKGLKMEEKNILSDEKISQS